MLSQLSIAPTTTTFAQQCAWHIFFNISTFNADVFSPLKGGRQDLVKADHTMSNPEYLTNCHVEIHAVFSNAKSDMLWLYTDEHGGRDYPVK